MSHYTILVILPKSWPVDPIAGTSEPIDASLSENKAQEIVSNLLARYDENIEVDAYETDCYCVNSIARKAATEIADAQYGSIDALRKSFKSPFPDERWDLSKEQQKQIDAAWKEHIAPYVEMIERYEQEHPLHDKGDPACPECHGSGKRSTTYNPLSKWDWYQIGGRWQGAMTEDRRDVFPLTDLQREWSVFAIVTPDGAWHAEGDMGWWGMTSNEDDNWRAKQHEIASSFPEHMGVLIDAHI